jgi:glycine/D-amino acid oxidase-like deaminating enzyme
MENFDAVVVGAGFGGIGAAIQLKRLGMTTSPSSSARLTWVACGTSTASRAWPSTSRPPRTRSGSTTTTANPLSPILITLSHEIQRRRFERQRFTVSYSGNLAWTGS